jgi:hypothetical protein
VASTAVNYEQARAALQEAPVTAITQATGHGLRKRSGINILPSRVGA